MPNEQNDILTDKLSGGGKVTASKYPFSNHYPLIRKSIELGLLIHRFTELKTACYKI